MVKFHEIKAGGTILLISDWADCMKAGSKRVREDNLGLYVYCNGSTGGGQGRSRHYLDGHLDDETDDVIGFAKAQP